jgi:hypothetical protein
MVERARRSVGATVAACRLAYREGIAANLGGGTHHSLTCSSPTDALIDLMVGYGAASSESCTAGLCLYAHLCISAQCGLSTHESRCLQAVAQTFEFNGHRGSAGMIGWPTLREVLNRTRRFHSSAQAEGAN